MQRQKEEVYIYNSYASFSAGSAEEQGQSNSSLLRVEVLSGQDWNAQPQIFQSCSRVLQAVELSQFALKTAKTLQEAGPVKFIGPLVEALNIAAKHCGRLVTEEASLGTK